VSIPQPRTGGVSASAAGNKPALNIAASEITDYFAQNKMYTVTESVPKFKTFTA
jgi:hypothetical protein